ncbi:hemin receptor [Aerophototrophica crusticola]|uniref:Hemin receptor n=2 Tax=Aerophototrophica crusticola TaxID=1709002 RepID=A0A858RBV4_9PROT|nr:hemin receptor [Rhodospirillaceae bacterium B3]
MTPEQVKLVQASFAKVVPIKEQAAALFYGKLFELDPALKPLFREDMVIQGQKLMASLAAAVAALKAPDAIVPVLRDMGVRHARYGVREKDYDTVGTALLWTLEQGLGAGFTPAVRDAWAATYALVSGVMKDAAATAPVG